MVHVSCEWVTSHITESRTRIRHHHRYALLIHMYIYTFTYVDMTHSHETPYIATSHHERGTWLIHMRHDSSRWDMTPSHDTPFTWLPLTLMNGGHDSFIWDMTPLYETWLFHMTPPTLRRHTWMRYVWCEWVMSHMTESCLIWLSHVSYDWVMSHMTESCLIWLSHVSHDRVMNAHHTTNPEKRPILSVYLASSIYACIDIHLEKSPVYLSPSLVSTLSLDDR